MSIDFDVVMIGSAASLSAAVEAVLGHVKPLGLTLGDPLYTVIGDEDRELPADCPDWESEVNRWPWVGLGLHQPGPPLIVVLEPMRNRALRASVVVSRGLLGHHFKEHTLDRILYAPLLQIARALGARAGVGYGNMDVEPGSDDEVLRDLGVAPGSESWADLGFVRREPGVPKPGDPFIVTERPEGYWLLESPYFRESLA